jgi:alpha/beta hydrolase fold
VDAEHDVRRRTRATAPNSTASQGIDLKTVPPVERVHRSRFIEVDGMRTHYLEAGEGPPVVLLHSGEFGGCAELSWEYLIPDLAQHFRVIAPDWLGFGQTAKVHDFESNPDMPRQLPGKFPMVVTWYCRRAATVRRSRIQNSFSGT